MRIVISTVALLALFGCTTNSGIVDLGGGNYVYEKEDAMAYNGNSTKVEILKEAAAFCAKQGKQMSVQSSAAKPYTPYSSYAGAEVQFSCKQTVTEQCLTLRSKGRCAIKPRSTESWGQALQITFKLANVKCNA